MNRLFKIICRSSPLSIIHAETAAEYLKYIFPGIQIRIDVKSAFSDAGQSAPLDEAGEKDAFAKIMDDDLLQGKADFIVHSLKDVGYKRMTGDPRFVGAVLERNDPRDLVIFEDKVLTKLAARQPLTLGTSSWRRETLVPPFLQRALPRLNASIPEIRTLPLRGDIGARLRSLQENNQVDGIIAAAAGINRLLSDEKTGKEIRALLSGTRIMALPLIECPPAPGQGALWMETAAANPYAPAIIKKLNNAPLLKNLLLERAAIDAQDGDCRRRTGAVCIDYKGIKLINIAGITAEGDMGSMQFEAPLNLTNQRLFSASNYMSDFFDYRPIKINIESLDAAAIFVSHHRAINDPLVVEKLKTKRLWASGTKSWFEMARKGLWVEGCADGFGLRFLDDVFTSPAINLVKENIAILTNSDSAERWRKEGFQAIGTYELTDNPTPRLVEQLKQADACFWTSFRQYQISKPFIKKSVIHLCPSGQTAELLKGEGIEPFIFPTIRAFLYFLNHSHLLQ